jgi:hypothetical protein
LNLCSGVEMFKNFVFKHMASIQQEDATNQGGLKCLEELKIFLKEGGKQLMTL